MVGLPTALAIGITVITFTERVGTTSGIGYQILAAQRSFALPDMWAGMLCWAGITGFGERIAGLPLPTLAAISGYALGGGAELAYACDFRIGTPSLRIGNPEGQLGIVAAAGAAWRLKELVGEVWAKEILLALRLTKLALRMPRDAHPQFDNLAQAVLFETEEKQDRITAFLDRSR